MRSSGSEGVELEVILGGKHRSQVLMGIVLELMNPQPNRARIERLQAKIRRRGQLRVVEAAREQRSDREAGGD
jgi:hypothetical protein